VSWTLPERHLVGEIAVGIARRLAGILEPADRMPPGYFFHMYTSDFEGGCDVLWRLGAARAGYGPEPERCEMSPGTIVYEKAWPPFFRLLQPAEIREMFSGDTPAPPVWPKREGRHVVHAPTPHDVLCAYLRVACDFGFDRLPSGRSPFEVPLAFAREIEALERAGYVARISHRGQWAEKISPAMQAAGLWREDGQSNEDIGEAALAAEIKAALGATPEHTLRVLAQEARRLSELDFVKLIKERFDGLYWTRNPTEHRAEAAWGWCSPYAGHCANGVRRCGAGRSRARSHTRRCGSPRTRRPTSPARC
jgi:hypothetical protein